MTLIEAVAEAVDMIEKGSRHYLASRICGLYATQLIKLVESHDHRGY